jgi:hypothetical protein
VCASRGELQLLYIAAQTPVHDALAALKQHISRAPADYSSTAVYNIKVLTLAALCLVAFAVQDAI